jgi:uncharacterized protein
MTTLVVPGHGGSGSEHWQTWIESRLDDSARVVQDDSTSLDLSAWAARVRWEIHRLPEPTWIVAHGFGCLAAIQAASDYSERIAGAMLVAPLDPHNLRLSSLLPELPLEFPSVIVASSNDPHMRLDKAAFWAGYWGSEFISIGAAGSVDPQSGFGPWPQGWDILEQLKSSSVCHACCTSKPLNRGALAI